MRAWVLKFEWPYKMQLFSHVIFFIRDFERGDDDDYQQSMTLASIDYKGMYTRLSTRMSICPGHSSVDQDRSIFHETS